MPRYRIFCSKSEAQNLLPGATITETYPAFVIASSSAEVMAEIQAKYLVEELKPPKDPPNVPTIMGLPTLLSTPPKRGPYFCAVRFHVPVRQAWLEEIEATGSEICQAIGKFTFVVRCPNKRSLAKIHQLSTKPRITPYTPHIHLSPDLFKGTNDIYSHNLCMPGLLIANFFTPVDRQRAKYNLRQQRIYNVIPAGQTDLIVDLMSNPDAAEALRLIARQRGLCCLEESALIQTHNNKAKPLIADGVFQPEPDGLGLTGEGEIVAVADTGLDSGDLTTMHPDFKGRVKDLRKMPIAPFWRARVENLDDDDPADRNTGHGTHLCGSILGDGTRSCELGVGPIAGVAPKAKLVFQALEHKVKWSKFGEDWWRNVKGEAPPLYHFLGVQDNLYELLQAAYDQEARIYVMAWSGGVSGAYDRHSQQLDQFVWEHPEMLVLVAAGNDGLPTRHPLEEKEDVVALGSVKPPATAKNCLTVGATENDRSEDEADVSENGQKIYKRDKLINVTYNDDPENRWLREPFQSDPLVNKDHIYAMSSRGPTQNGRRKPDVVAPGTFILSTRSQALADNDFGKWAAFVIKENQEASRADEARKAYVYDSGTSMSTALVAGCAALVRQYLREKHGMNRPTAALIKALLIHSAQYLREYEFAHPTSQQWADNEQGWGRVTLQSVLKPQWPQQVLFLDKKEGFDQTGELYKFAFKIHQPDHPFLWWPLRITLVYPDWPGRELINNLDLFVKDPNGRFYLGNGFAGLNTPDSMNNVEGIIVEYPAAGEWTIHVTASNLNLPQNDSQPFALVISGPIEQVISAANGWQIIESKPEFS
jgi:hypothetical protein